METIETLQKTGSEGWTDQELVGRIKTGDTALYEIIMRRYNQRLYRVARAILRDDAEAEDVMQDAYVRAYQHLKQFSGRGPFSAWLTRIAAHEALGRLRLRKRNPQLDDTEDDGELRMDIVETSPDPEQNASTAELGHLLEEALLALPEKYRTVVMLRDVEELSTSETAAALDLSEENVKIRLHRGHEMARGWLFSRVGTNAQNAFPFMGVRCDRVVQSVFERLAELSAGHSQIPLRVFTPKNPSPLEVIESACGAASNDDSVAPKSRERLSSQELPDYIFSLHMPSIRSRDECSTQNFVIT